MPAVPVEISSVDPALPARLMGTAGPLPGTSREVHSGAMLLFVGPVSANGRRVPAYSFAVEFATPNVAAAVSNWLWSTLHGHGAELRVGGEPVAMHHAAIKAALLAHSR